MNKANQLAQWVVDNRFAKSENEKVSDFEMYQTLVEGIQSFAKAVAEDALKRAAESLDREIIEGVIYVDKQSILSTPINTDL